MGCSFREVKGWEDCGDFNVVKIWVYGFLGNVRNCLGIC